MKSILMAILLILVNFNLCYGQDNERSSNFIYSIPVIEGMEPYGRVEEEILNISDFIEYAFIAKVFQSKEGRIISAEDICKFYHDHFVSLKFRPWQDASSLSGRYLAPSIVTKGNAHIRSQGHISYWIPREGNSVTFFIQQRRDFDIRQSQPVLDTIIAAFENASGEFNYKTNLLQIKLNAKWS